MENEDMIDMIDWRDSDWAVVEPEVGEDLMDTACDNCELILNEAKERKNDVILTDDWHIIGVVPGSYHKKGDLYKTLGR